MPPLAARTVSGTQDQKVVRIYIDNSNLWIQGQKTYAEAKHQAVSLDPTWRFDVGQLMSVLVENIELQNVDVKTNLYGSEPPPIDSVWKAIKSRNVLVQTFGRSGYTGREKEVDISLSLDAVMQAAEDTSFGVQSEFVIVSGDRDIYQAVSRIVQKKFRVHVWSWKNALAKIYTQKPEELIKVHLLDDYLDRISFSSTKFRVDREVISPHSIVVLDPLPKAAEVDEFLSTLQIPTYRYEYVRKRTGASSQDLIIIPVLAKTMTHEEHVLFLQSVRSKLETYGLKILTFFEYRQSYLRDDLQDEFQLPTRFKELSRRDEKHVNDNNGDDGKMKDDEVIGNRDEGFQEVNYRSEKRRVYLKKNEVKSGTRCAMRKYCSDGLSCKRIHTDDEQIFFKEHGPKKAMKYKLCINKPCPWGKECRFAHGPQELLCPTCDRIGAGHAMDKCPLTEDQRQRRF